MNDGDRLLTGEEVAARLGLSLQTLKRHLKNGPPAGTQGDVRKIQQKHIGRSVRFSKQSVDDFIADTTHTKEG